MAGVTDVKIRATIRDSSLPLNFASSDSILGYRRAYLHCLLERGFVSMVQNRLHCGPRDGGILLVRASSFKDPHDDIRIVSSVIHIAPVSLRSGKRAFLKL